MASARESATRLQDYFACLFRHNVYTFMWLAECAKQAGNWFTFVAAYAVIKELSVGDVALKTALFLICRRLPYLLLFPVTGLAADRLNRGALLVAVCLVQGAVSFTLPIVEKRGDVWLLYPLIMLQYSAQAFYDPARIAAIPTVIPRSLLCVAGTLDLSGFSLMALFGAAMAGHTAARYGTATCFRVEGFAFLTAAALMLRLARRCAADNKKAKAAAGNPSAARSGAGGSQKAARTISRSPSQPAAAPAAKAASTKPGRLAEPAGTAAVAANDAAATVADTSAVGKPDGGSLRPSRQSSLRSLSDAGAAEPPPELQPLLAELQAPSPDLVGTVARAPRVQAAGGGDGGEEAPRELPPPYALSDDGSPCRVGPGEVDGREGGHGVHAREIRISDGGRDAAAYGSDDEGGEHGGGGGGGTAPAGGCGGCGALAFLAQRRNWDVAALIWVKATGAMAWGAADVLNGRFSQMASMQTLGGPDVTLGLILVCVGFGSVLGPVVANGATPGVARYWRVSIAAAFLLLAAGYTLMAAAKSVAYVLPATVVRTTGSATIWVHSMAIMQHRLHEGIRGRLVALEFVLYTVSEAASTLFGGYALDSLGWSSRRLCLTLAGMGAVFAAMWTLNAWVLWDGPSSYRDERREPLLGAPGGGEGNDEAGQKA